MAIATESYKKSFHTRNDSGELDVFEAANYFSGYNNENPNSSSNKLMMREDYNQQRSSGRVSRISLDVPMMRRNSSLLNPPPHHQQINQNNNNNNNNKEKKFKQPSSPGGRFASFLNSLFNQTSSKKNKKPKSIKDELEEKDLSSGWRRKRRSSISHFPSSTTAIDDYSNSVSKSGFRTPPVCNNAAVAFTPTKSYKEFDRKYGKKSINNKDLSKSNAKIINDSLKEENRDDDDGAESDSSSDLFELPNYDLGIYNSSSGLPVYETTRMESIKRGVPISTI